MVGFLLVDQPRSGVENMAIDQAMVERAAREQIVLARLYAWSEPTLSLGYFQRVSDRKEQPTTRGMALVRRSTGGGAIVHHFDWTYSIAAPTAALNQPSKSIGASTGLYDLVHHQVVEMLKEFNLHARLCEETAPTCGDCSFLCFKRRARGDVLIDSEFADSETPQHGKLRDGFKVLGSAQRRVAGGLLQHGSLLLSTSQHAPSLPGLFELSRGTASANMLSSRFHRAISTVVTEFAGATEVVLAIDELVPEYDGSPGLFGNQAWTHRLP